MSIELYLAFVMAVTALILIPGPNVTLIVANSLAYGSRQGLITVAGTSTAIFCQLVIISFGVLSFLMLLSDWFVWLRWVGVAYLIYLAITTWSAPPLEESVVPGAHQKMFWQGFLISMTNPKTLLFYSAFFPQFIDPHGDVTLQLAILGLTNLVLATLFDSCWALLAGYAKEAMRRFRHVQNKVVAALYLTTATTLALVRRS